MHLLALPSLVACLIVNRRRGISLERLKSGIELIYPYIAEELALITMPTLRRH